MADVDVIIKAILDDKAFQAGVAGLNTGMNAMQKNSTNIFSKMGDSIKTAASGFLAAVVGVAALTKAIIDSGKAYMESELAATKLSNALKANNQYTEEGFNQMKSYATQLMFSTNVEKEHSMALMTTALNMGLTKDQAMKATEGAIGLNAALGVDMERALKGSVAAMQGQTTQLTRALPELKNFKTDAEKIAYVTETMRKGFIQAQENTKTFAGQLKFLENVGHEFEETVGAGIAEGLKPALDRLQDFLKTTEGMKEMQEVSQGIAVVFVVLGNVVGAAIRLIIENISSMIKLSKDAGKVLDDVFHGRFKEALEDSKTYMSDYAGGVKKDIAIVTTSWKDGVNGIKEILAQEVEAQKKNIDAMKTANVQGAGDFVKIWEDAHKQVITVANDGYDSILKNSVDALNKTGISTKDALKNILKDIANSIAKQLEMEGAKHLGYAIAYTASLNPLAVGEYAAAAEFGAAGVGIQAIAGSFATGLDRVPRDGMYKLHEDERVVPRGGSLPGLSTSDFIGATMRGMGGNQNTVNNNSAVNINGIGIQATSRTTIGDIINIADRQGLKPFVRS